MFDQEQNHPRDCMTFCSWPSRQTFSCLENQASHCRLLQHYKDLSISCSGSYGRRFSFPLHGNPFSSYYGENWSHSPADSRGQDGSRDPSAKSKRIPYRQQSQIHVHASPGRHLWTQPKPPTSHGTIAGLQEAIGRKSFSRRVHHLAHGASILGKKYNGVCPGTPVDPAGLPGLCLGRRQHPTWTQQEPGLLGRGPPGKHSAHRRSVQVDGRLRHHHHHQFHLPLRHERESLPERFTRAPVWGLWRYMSRHPWKLVKTGTQRDCTGKLDRGS